MRTVLFALALCGGAFGQAVTIGQPAFSGAGLNDVTSGGTFAGVAANHSYKAEICTAATPDTIKTSRDGGTATACRNLTSTVSMTYPAGTVSAASWTSGRATYTVTAHGLSTGALVTITGASGYNVAALPVLVTGANTFSVAIASTPGTWMSGGTVTASDGVFLAFAATTGHTVGNYWTVEVSANGSATAASFMSRGIGARSRSVQEKLRDFTNVKDFGAVCDGGLTDDRRAIQAAVDAVGAGALYLPFPGCGVSDRGDGLGVVAYPPNGGMALRGTSVLAPGIYRAGAGGGLVAYAPHPPTTLLTLYASNVALENLYLDCNDGAAAHGIVAVMGQNASWLNVVTRKCSSDNGRLDNYATPAAAITAGGTIGSSAITVAGITNDRLTFGEYYCTQVVFDPGTANVEQFAISRSGSVLTLIGGTLAHAHTTVQCAGNNDKMVSVNYHSYSSSGKGLRFMPGPDNNGGSWYATKTTQSALGGIEIVGSSNTFDGGYCEGDGGYCIQLGTVAGGLSSATTITNWGGMEENTSGYNTVFAACDDRGDVRMKLPQYLTMGRPTAVTTALGLPNEVCPNYALTGPSTVGTGTNNDFGSWTKNTFGMIVTQPGGPVTGGGVVSFYDRDGVLINKLFASGTGALASSKSVVDYSHAQLEASIPSTNLKTYMGYNSAAGVGFVQATNFGSSVQPFICNPAGGVCGTGAGGQNTAGPSVMYKGPNYIGTETGANNAVAGALLDLVTGSAVTTANGLTVTVHLAHTLALGTGNTFKLNGGVAFPISSHCAPAGIALASSYTAGADITMMFSSTYNYWLDMGPCTGTGITALTGDVTATGPGSVAATLSATGVAASTYTSVTVDAKGRVTGGTNPAISLPGGSITCGTAGQALKSVALSSGGTLSGTCGIP